MSRKRIVILGGGTGGTMPANRLRRRFDEDEAEIHVVDRDDRHVYQPGLLFVPFGLARVEEIVRPRTRQLRSGIVFHEHEVETVRVYPGLIMANGARMEGMEADLFFTFFGLDAIRRDRLAKIKVATVGNPGLHLPTWLGAVPGMSWAATRLMQRQLEKIDIPPIPESSSSSATRAHACTPARRASTRSA